VQNFSNMKGNNSLIVYRPSERKLAREPLNYGRQSALNKRPCWPGRFYIQGCIVFPKGTTNITIMTNIQQCKKSVHFPPKRQKRIADQSHWYYCKNCNLSELSASRGKRKNETFGFSTRLLLQFIALHPDMFINNNKTVSRIR